MNAILAVDSGGSKCDVILVDLDGHILGRGITSQPGVGGRSHLAMVEAVRTALPRDHFQSLTIVAIGKFLPMEIFRFGEMESFRVLVSAEAPVALAHANLKAGVVLLSGTGAFASCRTDDGRDAHFDGRSRALLGDFGGGYHIGTMALNAVIRSDWHARHATCLRGRILKKFGVAQPHALFSLDLYSRDRSLVASLAQDVAEEALAGDAVALSILDQAANALAETFRDLVATLDIAQDSYPVVGTGSLIRRCDLYWNSLWNKVKEIAPRFTPCRLREPPAVGMAIYGLRQVLGPAAAPAVAQLLSEAQNLA